MFPIRKAVSLTAAYPDEHFAVTVGDTIYLGDADQSAALLINFVGRGLTEVEEFEIV